MEVELAEADDMLDHAREHPGIPWTKIAGTRNRIVHGDDSVNYDVVWDIATVEIPALVAALERALPGH